LSRAPSDPWSFERHRLPVGVCWAELFERGADADATVEEIRMALSRQRGEDDS